MHQPRIDSPTNTNQKTTSMGSRPGELCPEMGLSKRRILVPCPCIWVRAFDVLCRMLWSRYALAQMGVPENRGTLFWGPYNKDPTI